MWNFNYLIQKYIFISCIFNLNWVKIFIIKLIKYLNSIILFKKLSLQDEANLISKLEKKLNLDLSEDRTPRNGKKTNLEKYTKTYKDNLVLTGYQIIALIGLLLGDAHAERQKLTGNTRLLFEQSTIHSEYLLMLHEIFEPLVGLSPLLSFRAPNEIKVKVTSTLKFQTLRFTCLNEYHEIFYLNKKKIIPKNIDELLTPIGLAFWLQDDGSYHIRDKIIVLSTDCFDESDVDLLIILLKKKFDLDCRKAKDRQYFRIVIKQNSIEKFKILVLPYIHSSMLYKLGL